jgi:hypothetical protein
MYAAQASMAFHVAPGVLAGEVAATIGFVYLIRPDKYIGHRNDDIDFPPVRDYFRTLVGEPGRSAVRAVVG